MPELGHLLQNNITKFQFLKEFKVTNKTNNFKIGDTLGINDLEIGIKVKIQGKSIGKGNTGNVKKNSFNRGPMSHGSKHHRLQGSIGSGTTPGRVFPGKRMPGRLGGTNVTISNLKIIDIDNQNNLVLVKGSIPGKKGNIVTINS
jgi:large subunit ribosomal protein L3